jgi:hypothetical protein
MRNGRGRVYIAIAENPISETPFAAPRITKHADEPEKEEHLVRVTWSEKVRQ